MAWQEEELLKDKRNQVVPQYLDSTTGKPAPLRGRNGAGYMEILGPDGNPISPPATEETLAGILAKLSADPATQTTLAAILAKTDLTLSALRDALRGVDAKTLSDLVTVLTAMKDTAGIKKITDTVQAQLTGSSLELFGATVAARPAANTVPVGAIYMAVQTQEIWQSDGTDWVVV